MSRWVGLALATGVTVALLWVVPLAGLIAFAVLLAVMPPWGKTYVERFLISLLVLLGTVAIVFPRSGATPVDSVSARLLFTTFAIAALALYALPQLRDTALPTFKLSDGLVVLVACALGLWTVLAYRGEDVTGVLSGLFFSGWDNQAHFTTFANTFVHQSTTWVAADGGQAWNQWYPSLHSTLWALGEYALGNEVTTRTDLLIPYVQWSALSFAIAMGALAWIASDFAGRWSQGTAGRRGSRIASIVAVGGMGAWILFGSPQWLFNSGFTNFAMGVSIVATASYLSVRSETSARTLGWFLVPLSAIAVIGLWTPLAIALAPAGVIVAKSLISRRLIAGIVWLVAIAALGLLLAWQQLGAILSAQDGATLGEFTEAIGSVPTGMAPFNIGAGIVAPFVAIAIAVMVRSPRTLAFGIAGPSVLTALLALAFIPGTDAAGTSRIQSYYVLKALDASLLVTAPLVAAAIATGFVILIRQLRTGTAIAASVAAALLTVTAFGYVGSAPDQLSSGFTLAPGVEAGRERASGVTKTFVATEILTAVDATSELPDFAPLNWNGSGTLPNLWAGTLHGTLSSTQQTFYLSVPPAPYGDEAADYIKEAIDAFDGLKVAVVTTTPESTQYVTTRLGTVDPRRLRIEPSPTG